MHLLLVKWNSRTSVLGRCVVVILVVSWRALLASPSPSSLTRLVALPWMESQWFCVKFDWSSTLSLQPKQGSWHRRMTGPDRRRVVRSRCDKKTISPAAKETELNDFWRWRVWCWETILLIPLPWCVRSAGRPSRLVLMVDTFLFFPSHGRDQCLAFLWRENEIIIILPSCSISSSSLPPLLLFKLLILDINLKPSIFKQVKHRRQRRPDSFTFQLLGWIMCAARSTNPKLFRLQHSCFPPKQLTW